MNKSESSSINEHYIAQGRLSGNQRHRLRKLLHMKYRPSEIAEEVGFNVRWFYDIYIPLGCSHERDSRRHIWIIGDEFHNWYIATYRKRKLVSCHR